MRDNEQFINGKIVRVPIARGNVIPWKIRNRSFYRRARKIIEKRAREALEKEEEFYRQLRNYPRAFVEKVIGPARISELTKLYMKEAEKTIIFTSTKLDNVRECRECTNVVVRGMHHCVYCQREL